MNAVRRVSVRLGAVIFLFAMSLSASLAATPSPHRAERRHIVLLHGLGDDASKMRALKRHFAAQGHPTHALKLNGSWGQLGIDGQAEELRAYVDAHLPRDEQFDLIGFSMGGIVSRYYVQRLGGLKRVRRLVTVASPHRGTIMAYLLPTKACRQMRPGSRMMRDLASDADQLTKVGFTSFWTPLDLIVIPASNAIVPGQRAKRIWCIAHPLMVFEPRCLRAIAACLEAPLD
jgi:triacylglycerol lipase